MTFSVVALDPVTGDLGAAVQSKFLAAGAVVIDARAGAGAIASQALCKTTYRTQGLEEMARGVGALDALDSIKMNDPLPQRRQVAMVDHSGGVAAHTGSGCMVWAGHITGSGFSCQGNGLVSKATVQAMAEVMEDLDMPFPERLVGALIAGQAAGGDARGQQSAALVVVRQEGGYGGDSDRMIDLRVDDHPTPIEELRRILDIYHLYFDKPGDGDLIAIDSDLSHELAQRLTRLQGVPVGDDDAEELWDRLERWAGKENLEERMVRRGHIDQTVLRVLREMETE